MRVWGCAVCLLCAGLIPACAQWSIDSADREVAALIQNRQMAALGFSTETALGAESGAVERRTGVYSFVPSPVDPAVPAGFQRATAKVDASGADGESGGAPDAPSPADGLTEEGAPVDPPRPFAISDALSYAMNHSRRYQTEKELLYLSALDLTLERHLWTPRFVQSVLSLDHDEADAINSHDQTFTAVANLAIEQRLPYGGEVTARVLSSLMRDIGENIALGETGQLVIEGRIPLLRGAGRTAYESRYRAERELVYAVRSFERFRREFLVEIATDFFDLLSRKTQIESANNLAARMRTVFRREKALVDADRNLQFDADRARNSMLTAQDSAQVARENFETALDFFKIRLGMLTRENIDLVDEMLDLNDPGVSVREATEAAIGYRLDLTTARDRVDDARRAVEVARNNLLPQVDLRAGMTTDTDPTRLNTQSFDSEHTRWSAGVEVEIPLERKRERNDYRGALVALRRAERNYEEFRDTVRLEVRRAVRRIASAKSTMMIQAERIRINEFRAAMAQAKLDAGENVSMLDVVDAQEDLTRARNDSAASLSDFRRAVLEFLRDSGTLRAGDDGVWARYGADAPLTAPDGGP